MALLRRLIKPRRYPRFHAGKGVFVVFGPYTPGERRMPIVDISEGGCGFVYSGMEEELDRSGSLSLLADDIPYLERVNFATAWDASLVKTDTDGGELRRRGVEFKWLGAFDQMRIKEFIKQNAICPAS